MLAACSGSPQPPPFVATLEPLDSIGCLDCSGPEQFGAVLDISLGPDGTLAILTREEPHVRIAVPGEARLRSFGARGQGPGELSNPLGVVALANGDFLVVGQHVDRFSPEGLHLERVERDPGSDGARLIQFVDASPSGRWIVAHEAATYLEPSARLRVSEDGMRTTGPPLTGPDAWHGEADTRSRLFVAHAISDEGVIAIGLVSGAYALMLVDQDGSEVHGRRDLERMQRSEEEIEELNRLIGGTIAESGVTLPGGWSPPSVSPELPHYSMTSFRFDGMGRLWVLTPRGGTEGTVFDVFSNRLEYLGEVRAPERIGGFDLGYGTLAGVVRGEFDVPILKVWRVVEASNRGGGDAHREPALAPVSPR